MSKNIILKLAEFSLFILSHTTYAAPHYNVNDYYQVYKDGRIYITT